MRWCLQVMDHVFDPWKQTRSLELVPRKKTAGVATYSITEASAAQETAGAVTYSFTGFGARFVTGAGAVYVWARADASFSIPGAGCRTGDDRW